MTQLISAGKITKEDRLITDHFFLLFIYYMILRNGDNFREINLKRVLLGIKKIIRQVILDTQLLLLEEFSLKIFT